MNTAQLKRLFDSQVQRLEERGVGQSVLDSLSKRRESVLAKVAGMVFRKARVPFLPVIPLQILDMFVQTKMVFHKGKDGRAAAGLVHEHGVPAFKDRVLAPEQPYYILDVEDGAALLDKSPQKAETIVQEQKRSCLIVPEIISLCIHTHVLSHHDVDATGSFTPRRYDFIDKVWSPSLIPILRLCYGQGVTGRPPDDPNYWWERPDLVWHPEDQTYFASLRGSATPSCVERF